MASSARAGPAETVLALLDLEQLDRDLYRGTYSMMEPGRPTLYGGQVAAQDRRLVAGRFDALVGLVEVGARQQVAQQQRARLRTAHAVAGPPVQPGHPAVVDRVVGPVLGQAEHDGVPTFVGHGHDTRVVTGLSFWQSDQ